MPFVCRPGLNGKVYIPEPVPGAAQKNNCENCFACQSCSNDRCGVCLNRNGAGTPPECGVVRRRAVERTAGVKG